MCVCVCVCCCWVQSFSPKIVSSSIWIFHTMYLVSSCCQNKIMQLILKLHCHCETWFAWTKMKRGSAVVGIVLLWIGGTVVRSLQFVYLFLMINAPHKWLMTLYLCSGWSEEMINVDCRKHCSQFYSKHILCLFNSW